ncbi:hypothetical protein V7S43_014163 [Phytophthora oleae]|uniref:Uncharacterized protein n=1 Tax=Phytophthora oleae TaxID=2107226 RepID=A0ABD3F5N4_9STRA
MRALPRRTACMWDIASSPENIWLEKQGALEASPEYSSVDFLSYSCLIFSSEVGFIVQECYVRRERQYKGRTGELEALLSDSRAKKSKENTLDASMDRVRAMHQSIMESVDQVQHRTSKVLQGNVQEEVESEKNKTDDGASAWIEKCNQLETEVEWTKELDDRLDGFTCARTSSSRSPIYTTLQKNLLSNLLQNFEVVGVGVGVGVGEAVVDTGVRLNQSLTRENQRLKTQFST